MLYIVATPIGNLKDVTLRALEVLKEVDFILCEDTRVTKRLLERYEIEGKKLVSYHQHSSEKKVEELVELIRNNKVALVTDAGTPGISDPGGLLIKALKQQSIKTAKHGNIEIVPVPGASAVTAALSISGLPTDKFVFMGFPPHKKGRNKFFKEALESKHTVVFYESCYRIVKCLEQLATLINAESMRIDFDIENHQFVICRELTKKFETIYRGGINEVLERVKRDPQKGEYVVVMH